MDGRLFSSKVQLGIYSAERFYIYIYMMYIVYSIYIIYVMYIMCSSDSAYTQREIVTFIYNIGMVGHIWVVFQLALHYSYCDNGKQNDLPYGYGWIFPALHVLAERARYYRVISCK